MPFGSIFHTFDQVLITGDVIHLTFKNNSLTRLGFKVLGIPHIGLRLRAKKIKKNLNSPAILVNTLIFSILKKGSIVSNYKRFHFMCFFSCFFENSSISIFLSIFFILKFYHHYISLI